MASALILETTFLIDLERERQRRKKGPVGAFLDNHHDDRLMVTPTVVGELAAGLADDGWERLQRFLAPFRVLEINEEVCWRYSRIYRYLRDHGQLIGANDLWIAATASTYEIPVVTANEKHYRRVPGISVLSYVSQAQSRSKLDQSD